MPRPRRLRARLVVSHLIVALAALGTVLVAVSLVGPGYFAEAMGHGPGDPTGDEMDAATLAAFQDAVRAALMAALAIGLAAAILIALALSARIATPVSRLVDAARRIAAGHYAERVPIEGGGEIGELAESFNAMAGSLEATERRRLDLVGDVAHELRTPLATIDGYLEGLQDGVVAASPATLTMLRGETQRLARLVDDLSELWRAEAHQLPLRIEVVDAGAVVRAVVAQFGGDAEAAGITLTASVPEGLRVRADPDRVRQILANYAANALRYAPAGSTVDIRGETSSAGVTLAVCDDGPGLTPEQRAHVFDRFYRVDPSRSRAVGGAGIGLAIAAALAEAMGGRVNADSPGPGLGSTFSVTLPEAALRP